MPRCRCIGYTWRPHSDRRATDLDGNGIVDPDEYASYDHSLCSIKGSGIGESTTATLNLCFEVTVAYVSMLRPAMHSYQPVMDRYYPE
eukprot:COSAG01_NODE_19921_length_981_cov_4.710884_1_plen_88_part_00